ncbi:hypothetical protein BS50DRAFT_574969 [Corynespora cassiicola Philippines]|uniref:Uncharacterized protein n=1 Tax=Corynespora cassiicola Philippines TaxID=1448308 RepID=A0A2T2NHA5_CORCC|nr:hypothetical protein BS50DRAFT_574969 [Corynespora cassiicola Philippines]
MGGGAEGEGAVVGALVVVLGARLLAVVGFGRDEVCMARERVSILALSVPSPQAEGGSTLRSRIPRHRARSCLADACLLVLLRPQWWLRASLPACPARPECALDQRRPSLVPGREAVARNGGMSVGGVRAQYGREEKASGRGSAPVDALRSGKAAYRLIENFSFVFLLLRASHIGQVDKAGRTR